MKNRARLIEAAADLFYRQGYQATSVEDVLAATAVARSNFYYHFANLLELAREVVRHSIGEYDRNLVEPTLGDLSLSPAQRLRQLFERADRSQDCAAGHIVGLLPARVVMQRYLDFRLWFEIQPVDIL